MWHDRVQYGTIDRLLRSWFRREDPRVGSLLVPPVPRLSVRSIIYAACFYRCGLFIVPPPPYSICRFALEPAYSLQVTIKTSMLAELKHHAPN